MMDLGLQLQQLRKQRGLTQRALAERINKSPAAVSSYETNAQIPPLDVLISIASTLNVSLDYLVGFDQRDIIVLENLSPSQKEIMNLLMEEFSTVSLCKDRPSDSQFEILKKLLCVFFSE